MPLHNGAKIPENISAQERVLLSEVENLINSACLRPAETLDTVVRIPTRNLGSELIEKLLTALQVMHKAVGERTSFKEINNSCWEFTVHYDDGTHYLAV